MNELEMIKIGQLNHHPDNPRKDLGDLSELADSIRTNGIMQNLTVVEADVGYNVIIGNRRLEAAKIAGLKELPCAIVELTPQEQMATMLAENMQRADLTILEQARGFQYMLDLGETPQSIADRTGFSKSTIRRRVKLLELDAEKLEKAFEDHQISMDDIDKINSIDDLKERNKLLSSVGTGNFNWAYKSAKSAQESEALHAKVREMMINTALKEVDYNAAWRDATKMQVGHLNIEQPKKDEDLRQAVDEAVKKFDKADSFAFSYGSLYFYAERKDEEQAKQTKAEKEKEKKIELHKKVAAELAAASKKAYELRYEFVKGYPKTQAKKHYKDILAVLVKSCVRPDDDDYCLFCEGLDDTTFKEMSGILSTTRDDIDASASKIIADAPEKMLLNYVYAIFSDNHNNNYISWGKDACNGFGENDELDILYAFLEKLGYVISDEEKQLQNGTHPLFVKGADDGK